MTLDDRILAAHRAGNATGLIALFDEAAGAAEAAGDVDQAAFLLTYAWVFALEQGDARANGFRARLTAWDRVT